MVWLAAGILPSLPAQTHSMAMPPIVGQGPLRDRVPRRAAGAGGPALGKARTQSISVLGLQQQGDPSSIPLTDASTAAGGSGAEWGARQG